MSEGDGYTLREAADRLGLSVRQARRYVLDGRLAAVMVPGPRGPEYRVGVADLEALEATRKRRPASRKGGRTLSARELDTLASPETTQRLLSDHLAALERAWQRIADLESENASLRAALSAGSSPQSAPEAPPAPAPSAARRRQTLRERARRLFGGRRSAG